MATYETNTFDYPHCHSYLNLVRGIIGSCKNDKCTFRHNCTYYVQNSKDLDTQTYTSNKQEFEKDGKYRL